MKKKVTSPVSNLPRDTDTISGSSISRNSSNFSKATFYLLQVQLFSSVGTFLILSPTNEISGDKPNVVFEVDLKYF